MSIPEGCYYDGQHLIETISDLFNAQFGKSLRNIKESVAIQYQKSSNRMMIRVSSKMLLAIKFCPELFVVLGGDTNIVNVPVINDNSECRMYLTNPIELNAGQNLLFIYSDIVEYGIVGDTLSPLIRVMPFTTEKHTPYTVNLYHVHKEFVHPHYLPVAKSYFDTIQIGIKDETGNSLRFLSGKTTVKLHFRKQPYRL